MKKMLKLFGFCGLSTLFWGVMFGGYFGDAPTVIAKDLLWQGVHNQAAVVCTA